MDLNFYFRKKYVRQSGVNKVTKNFLKKETLVSKTRLKKFLIFEKKFNCYANVGNGAAQP